jgi:hypothetical protein
MNRRSEGKQAVPRRISRQDATSAGVVETSARRSALRQNTCGMITASASAQPDLDLARIVAMEPVRQSWRLDRTMISAPAILTLVPDTEQQQMIAEYIEEGGAWPVASSAENATLLDFLASRLPNPSHALSLCRMGAALTRAALGAESFVEPDYRSFPERSKREMRMRIEHEAWNCIERAMRGRVATESWDHIERSSWDSVESAVWNGIEREALSRLECDAWHIIERSARNRIERGLYASLVWFYAEPRSVLLALHGAPLPPEGAPAFPVLFGPGVPNLCRAATPDEVVLWASLPTDDTRPDIVERLLAEGIVGYTD